jgi:hypothetical protein
MWSWRSKFNAWSGLDAIHQFLELPVTAKTKITWPQWMRVLGWDKEYREAAQAEIVEHCEIDVGVTESVYRVMVEANAIRGLRRDGGVI